MTQTEAVKVFMEKHGSITALQAFQQLGITALSSRIADLRRSGVAISSRPEEVETRYGRKARYSRYYLKE